MVLLETVQRICLLVAHCSPPFQGPASKCSTPTGLPAVGFVDLSDPRLAALKYNRDSEVVRETTAAIHFRELSNLDSLQVAAVCQMIDCLPPTFGKDACGGNSEAGNRLLELAVYIGPSSAGGNPLIEVPENNP